MTKRQSRRLPSNLPGYEGRFEIGARIVDDPYNPGEFITVPANVRHDPLALMFSRNEIDEAQYRAGEKLRGCLEAAGGAGARASDWTRPYVDRSPKSMEPALSQMDAAKELKRACVVLGYQRYRLVRGVVFDGLNGTLIAVAKGSACDRREVKAAVRDGLEELAILWNFLSAPQYRNRRSAMLAWINDFPVWDHEAREVKIRYA